MIVDHHELNLPTRAERSPLPGAICSTKIFYALGRDNDPVRKEIFECNWMIVSKWWDTREEAEAELEWWKARDKDRFREWIEGYHVVRLEITETLSVCK